MRDRGQFGSHPLQRELSYRASDSLPFIDQKVIDGVIRTIMVGMYSIRDRSGSVIYPYGLSQLEEKGVRRILERHNSGLLARIDGFVPVRLEEGMGTEILVREKRRGGLKNERKGMFYTCSINRCDY